MNQYCQICRTYHEIRSAPCTGSVTTYAPIDINAEIVARDATIAELRATIDRPLGADAQWEYAKCWRDKAEKAEARIAELEVELSAWKRAVEQANNFSTAWCIVATNIKERANQIITAAKEGK